AWFDQQRDRFMTVAARWYVAIILALEGDHERAESELREALSLVTSRHRPVVQATLAQVLLRRAKTGQALEHALEASKALADRPISEGDAVVRLAHAEALRAAGRTDESVAAIRAARDRLLARATRIARPEWRTSFLEIPDHARTLVLSKEWEA